VYVEPPCGVLGTPARVLCGFTKTKLLAPGETQTLTVSIPKARLASYDESGETGYRSAYVLQAGAYSFYLGENVRDAVRVAETRLPSAKRKKKTACVCFRANRFTFLKSI